MKVGSVPRLPQYLIFELHLVSRVSLSGAFDRLIPTGQEGHTCVMRATPISPLAP